MIFPQRSFELESSLDPQQIHRTLAPHVGIAPTPTPYLGMVSVGGFEIRPNIRHRNAFIPFASGTVAPSASGAGSHVAVTMRMGPFARAFLGLWFSMAAGFMLLVATMAIITGLRGEGGGVVVFGGLFLFMCMFPVFGVLLSRYGFRREADPLERFLREALHAASAPPYR